MALWNDKTDPDAFPEQPQQPTLSPSACLSPRGLRAFLALSRHSTDDVLRQRLNSLESHKRVSLCTEYAQSTLFPAWKARSSAIEYCSSYAATLRTQLNDETEPEVQRIVQNEDLRLDPYAQRDLEVLKDSKSAQLTSLENWISNERTIETIVRDRSSDILRDVCGYEEAMTAFEKWGSSLRK